MGKLKFIFILIVALFLICGIVMFADAPSSFDDSMELIPVSDSGNVNQSDCDNYTCFPEFNTTDESSDSAKGTSDKINYDSKNYDGSIIKGLYFCNDFEHAFKDAKAHHKNIMIVFDGPACVWCEYLKDETLTDPDVQKEINDNDIILITLTSESPELSERLGVHGTPTTVIFDENGNELGRIDGFEPPEEYLPDLKEINGN